MAGSDSGGGAGIQADLRVFSLLGVWGMSAITAVTAQNSMGVQHVQLVPPAVVSMQMDSVLDDIGQDAVKSGMLPSREHVETVARKLVEYAVKNVVVDPVMVAKGGAALCDEGARQAFRTSLIPVALVVTPNVPEAEVLSLITIRTVNDMREAAHRIHSLGAQAVLVKGGHLREQSAHDSSITDVLYDGTQFTEFSGVRYNTKNTHGTGCTLSSAIAAYLAKGHGIHDAVAKARRFVEKAVQYSFPLGKGHGPTNAWAATTRGGERREP